MDWIRKLLGYHDRPREDGNPFRSPTWDEIMRKKDSHTSGDSEDSGQHPQGHIFHGDFPNSDMFSPHQEFFGQIDDMFSQLEGLMKEMHRHPAWALPDSLSEPEPQRPRDFMLKVPDNDQADIEPAPAPYHPHYGHESEKWGSQSGPDDFSEHTNPFAFSPHSLFDRIFKDFGMDPGETPFAGHFPELGSEPDSEDHSRESLMKRKDSDIDEVVSGGLSKLPEGGPSYSHDSLQNLEPRQSPWPRPESPGSPHAGVHQKFYSQSVVIIRRPDGSIEETKKYSDSSGREEVTVTHKQPEEGNIGPGPVQPGGPMDQVPSIFSWLFTR